MTNYRYPKSLRLLKPAEFDHVFRQRCRASDGVVVVYASTNKHEHARLGLTVSRKVGKAHVRNRWKRSLREAFRLVQHDLPGNLDLVVLPCRGRSANVALLKRSLLKLAPQLAARLSEANQS